MARATERLSRLWFPLAAGALALALREEVIRARTTEARVLISLAVVAAFAATGPGPRIRPAFLAAGIFGATSTALFVVDPDVWGFAALLAASAAAARRHDPAAVALLLSPLALPVLLFSVALGSGNSDAASVLAATVRHAARFSSLGVRSAAVPPCFFLLATLAPGTAGGAWPRPAVVVSLGAVLSLVFMRLESTLLLAALPSDVMEWSESPLLLAVLKLDRGAPPYGPWADVNSYTYAPGLPLLHRALLSPFHAELRPEYHHALVIGWELVTALFLAAAALRPLATRVRAETALRVTTLAVGILGILWSSPASPGLHPDHLVHVGVALSVFLLLGREHLPPRAFWIAVGLLPALVSAAKLTAAGLAFGLLLALLPVDRRRALAAAALSGVVAIALVVLFDACLGPFSSYAIRLMASHPVHLGRLPSALASGPGLVVVAALVAGLSAADAEVRGLARFTAGLAVPTVAAYLKEGGAWNNLVAAALPAAVVLVLLAARGGERRLETPRLAATVAAILLVVHPTALFTRSDARLVRADHLVAVSALAADLHAGRTPLSLGSVAAWVDAGGAGVPRDLAASAVELFMARSPEFDHHLARLASGRYSTIVAQGRTFVPMTSVARSFAPFYLDALGSRYCVVHPTDSRGTPVPLAFGSRLLVLRRRDLGCAPLTATP